MKFFLETTIDDSRKFSSQKITIQSNFFRSLYRYTLYLNYFFIFFVPWLSTNQNNINQIKVHLTLGPNDFFLIYKKFYWKMKRLQKYTLCMICDQTDAWRLTDYEPTHVLVLSWSLNYNCLTHLREHGKRIGAQLGTAYSIHKTNTFIMLMDHRCIEWN